MSTAVKSGLQQEWLCLQNQYDSYEKYSLMLKLLALVLCPALLFVVGAQRWTMLFIGLLWLQDAIWKTYQSRIAERLLVLEKGILADEGHLAMQFNSSWLASRPGSMALITQYLGQACKPTVAYPHLLLLMLSAVYLYVS